LHSGEARARAVAGQDSPGDCGASCLTNAWLQGALDLLRLRLGLLLLLEHNDVLV